MKRNKLLTGFLVLGMGLSLVACSSNEPETKIAEEKEEKKIVLIHSFEQKKDTYPIFNETLKRTFDKPDSIERYCRILESYEHRHRAQ